MGSKETAVNLEKRPHWPRIELSPDTQVREALAQKADEYVQRISHGEVFLSIGGVLQREWRAYEDSGRTGDLTKTKAYLRLVFISFAMLAEGGACEGSEVMEQLTTDNTWREQFMNIQIHAPEVFEQLALDAAWTIKGYASGEVYPQPRHPQAEM